VDNREIKDYTNLKQILAHEPIMARLFRDAGGETLPLAKLFFVMNDPPIISGGDDLTDRVRILAFSNPTPEGVVNSNLGREIAEERDGILQWTLGFLTDMLELHEMPFAEDQDSQERQAEFRKAANPCKDFADKYGKLGPNYCCKPTELYWAASDFIHDTLSSFSIRGFVNKFVKRFHLTDPVQERITGVRPRGESDRARYRYGFKLEGTAWEESKARHQKITAECGPPPAQQPPKKE
jgi:phage/plasmid-associated DNA primase